MISVKNLSKKYRIGKRQRSGVTLRESIMQTLHAPFHRKRRNDHPKDETMWALKKVSFEVMPGEIVGIIGNNGAGKTTLLKILSRITKPTSGQADLYGKVGSLLEVGTGFHPDLTGRENIYLNGAILGMRRREINRKYDDIVSFAGIEQFLDTPVKRYSTGMHARLAFAVAAHLETEILLVDEVLAVGDAQFQRKCLERLQQVGTEGKTILFVSHNMSAMRLICSRGLLIDQGEIIEDGDINSVVDTYLVNQREQTAQPEFIETPSFTVENVRINSTTGPVIKTFDPVEIRVKFTAKKHIGDPGLYVGIMTQEGHRVAGLDFNDFDTVNPLLPGQQLELGFRVDSLPILPGTYKIELYMKDMFTHSMELVPKGFEFDVAEDSVYGGRKLDRWCGLVGLKASPIVKMILPQNNNKEPVNI